MRADLQSPRRTYSAIAILGGLLLLMTAVCGILGYVAEVGLIRQVLAQNAIAFEQNEMNALSLQMQNELLEYRRLLASRTFRQDAQGLLHLAHRTDRDLFPFQTLWVPGSGTRPPVPADRFNAGGYYVQGGLLWLRVPSPVGPILGAVPVQALLEKSPIGNGTAALLLSDRGRILADSPTGQYEGLNALPPLRQALRTSPTGGQVFYDTRFGPSFVTYRHLSGTGMVLVLVLPEAPALKPLGAIEQLIVTVILASMLLVAVVLAVLFLWYRRWSVRVEQTAAGISAGQYHLRLPEQGPRELATLAQAANRALDALGRARRQHSALRKAYAALLNGRSEEEVLRTIVHEAVHVEQAPLSVLFLPDADRKRMVPHTWFGSAGEYIRQMGRETPVPQIDAGGPIDQAFTGRHAVVVRNTQSDLCFAPWRETARQYGLLSMVAVPVRLRDEVLGVLAVYDRLPDVFSLRRVARIQEFAEASAFTLLRLRDGARMAHLATTDPLTGLSNRHHFEAQFPSLLARALRGRQPFCLVMLDLDRFKHLNDTQGHQGGDFCLKEVGEALRGVMRQGDMAVRMGGDEFLLLLFTDRTGSMAAVERIRTALPLQKYGIGISGGLAIFPDDGEDYQTLYRRADERLYAAKRSGGDAIRFPSTEEELQVT